MQALPSSTGRKTRWASTSLTVGRVTTSSLSAISYARASRFVSSCECARPQPRAGKADRVRAGSGVSLASRCGARFLGERPHEADKRNHELSRFLSHRHVTGVLEPHESFPWGLHLLKPFPRYLGIRVVVMTSLEQE